MPESWNYWKTYFEDFEIAGANLLADDKEF